MQVSRRARFEYSTSTEHANEIPPEYRSEFALGRVDSDGAGGLAELEFDLDLGPLGLEGVSLFDGFHLARGSRQRGVDFPRQGRALDLAELLAQPAQSDPKRSSHRCTVTSKKKFALIRFR